MSESSEVVNWTEALAAVNGDRELLVEVVQVLVDDLQRLLDGIAAAVREEDPDGVRDAGHTMKGSLRFLGNTQAHDLAEQLEEMGAKPDLTGVEGVWESFQSEIERLRPILKEFCS